MTAERRLARLAGDAEIALVITDLEMPELDGLELTRAIRAGARARRCRWSSSPPTARDEDRRLGLEAGADAYIVKRAFDQQALLDDSSSVS